MNNLKAFYLQWWFHLLLLPLLRFVQRNPWFSLAAASPYGHDLQTSCHTYYIGSVKLNNRGNPLLIQSDHLSSWILHIKQAWLRLVDSTSTLPHSQMYFLAFSSKLNRYNNERHSQLLCFKNKSYIKGTNLQSGSFHSSSCGFSFAWQWTTRPSWFS